MIARDKRFTGERTTFETEQRYLIYESISRYNFAMPYCRNKKVLDIGCGEGFGTALLADVAEAVIGIDNSITAIDYANPNFKRSNLKFMKMDGVQLAFGRETFELVTAFEVIEHLSDPEKFLSETIRVIKDNGIVILSTMQRHTKRPSGNPFHIKEYSLGEFKDILSKYYKVAELFGASCIRKKNPIQKFIMGLDSRGILRGMRQRFNFKIISKVEKFLGTTPPGEVSEGDFIVTKDNVSKSTFMIAVCRNAR